MMSIFNKPTIYLSHPILGVSKDMVGNCEKAIKAAAKLRTLFPEINFYVPAESDIVLQLLYNSKRLSVDDILWADLKIVDSCHGWIFLHWEDSGGCEKERQEAIKIGLPQFEIVDDVSRMSYGRIRKRFTDIIEQTKKYYKRNKNVI